MEQGKVTDKCGSVVTRVENGEEINCEDDGEDGGEDDGEDDDGDRFDDTQI